MFSHFRSALRWRHSIHHAQIVSRTHPILIRALITIENQFRYSVSPKNVMVVGMLSQIVCGNLTGIIKIYEFHVCFRWLSACTCALMYTSGQMICKSEARTNLFMAFLFVFNWQKSRNMPGRVMSCTLCQSLFKDFFESIYILFFKWNFQWFLVLDITSGRARIIVSIIFELFWSIGLIFLPVFSLFIENWWELYIAISMPTILMVILYR